MPIIKNSKSKSVKKSDVKAAKPVAGHSHRRATRDHLGSLELMVLLAVKKLKTKAYGAGIAASIQTKADIHVHIGAVYTSLSRMTKKKLISGSMGESTSSRGGRAKRFYTLTTKGEEAVDKSVAGIRSLAA